MVSFEDGSPTTTGPQSPDVAQEVFAEFSSPPDQEQLASSSNREVQRNQSASSLGKRLLVTVLRIGIMGRPPGSGSAWRMRIRKYIWLLKWGLRYKRKLRILKKL